MWNIFHIRLTSPVRAEECGPTMMTAFVTVWLQEGRVANNAWLHARIAQVLQQFTHGVFFEFWGNK